MASRNRARAAGPRDAAVAERELPPDGRKRAIIENVTPCVDDGRYPVKRVVGEEVVVEADVFCDGHDHVAAVVRYTTDPAGEWQEVPMSALVNDRWRARFTIDEMTRHYFTVHAWVDHFDTWKTDFRKRFDAGQQLDVDLRIGLNLIRETAERAGGADGAALQRMAATIEQSTSDMLMPAIESPALARLMFAHVDKTLATEYARVLEVVVDRTRAGFGAWYELFPRSCGKEGHGTFKDAEGALPYIADMGFDIVYLPPIHPIGMTNRKGRNNSVTAEEGEPGSPWAIGSKEGGHKAIEPSLGTMEDFERFVARAGELNLEVALDIAFQCSPDHPYVREHPEWFMTRPDGTIQYAENPPKKYEDIVPFNFGCEQWEALWQELKSVVQFWIDKGIRIFRVDNPHTKPFRFWAWLIEEIRSERPDVLFLSEAFTRPKVMQRLAKVGFTQSYTYFTWRNTKWELTQYLTELTQSPVREFLRPNFWPNTPDILPEYLQYGGRPAFVVRHALAATLSGNYGMYGPVYEKCIGEALPGREEYANSEKYELKQWDFATPSALTDLIARMNRIRRENPAFHTTNNLRFYDVDNDMILFYGKTSVDGENTVFVVVNLDPFHKHSGWVRVPIGDFGIAPGQSYLMYDLLGEGKYVWQGEHNYVELDPYSLPVHIFRLHRQLKRESDFDYYL